MTDNTQELEKEVALLVANLAHDHMMTLQATGRADFTPFNRAIIDWHNKQIEAYHNELTDNEKKVWIYADDLKKRKAKAVEEVLDRIENSPNGAYSGTQAHTMINDAIRAERNKLKESKNDAGF